MTPTILIVEDDTITRFMMTEMCDKLGFRCETVPGGQECIDLVDEDPHRFAMILMDIHMPRVSGLAASQHIRSTRTDPPKNLPIVAVTADEHWHNPHRCKAAGFNGVIAKPVTLGKLSDTLNSLLI